MDKEIDMSHYYKNPDPDRNVGMTQGSVVLAIRDYEAERLPQHQQFPRAVSDVEFCNYVEYLYIACGKQDNFRNHPEYRQGIEICCQNKSEAEHLNRLMWDRYTTVVKYKVTYQG